MERTTKSSPPDRNHQIRIARCRPMLGSAAVLLFLLLALPPTYPAKIKMLMAGNMDLLNSLRIILGSEPLVSYVAVPCRIGGVVTVEDALRFIRLYFPRTYEIMRSYDVIMLTQPEYNLFTPRQDQWIYDAIKDGAGGINDGSVFSIQSNIHRAWANSLASQAFPNDAPAVSAKGGGEAYSLLFRVMINRECPDPILTPFVPFGVEKVKCIAASRLVIPRQGAGILAWQIGNFPALDKAPYLVAWDYGKGRTMTSGDFMGNGWFGAPSSPDANQYSPDILMNMIFHLTKRRLIEDVPLFHNVKVNFEEFTSRIVVLISLKDFIDRFGANTQAVQAQISKLEDTYRQGVDWYMNQEYGKCEQTMQSGIGQFSEAEKLAMKAKDAALFWIYLIEWLVSLSTVSISGFALWTLMIRRRLYRSVKITRQR